MVTCNQRRHKETSKEQETGLPDFEFLKNGIGCNGIDM